MRGRWTEVFSQAGFVAKRQTAGIKCTHRVKYAGATSKSTFLPYRGDSLHWFTWNLARQRGTWARLATQNFTPIGARGWEGGPNSGKFILFG